MLIGEVVGHIEKSYIHAFSLKRSPQKPWVLRRHLKLPMKSTFKIGFVTETIIWDIGLKKFALKSESKNLIKIMVLNRPSANSIVNSKACAKGLMSFLGEPSILQRKMEEPFQQGKCEKRKFSHLKLTKGRN